MKTRFTQFILLLSAVAFSGVAHSQVSELDYCTTEMITHANIVIVGSFQGTSVQIEYRYSEADPWSVLDPSKYSISGNPVNFTKILVAPNQDYLTTHFKVTMYEGDDEPCDICPNYTGSDPYWTCPNPCVGGVIPAPSATSDSASAKTIIAHWDGHYSMNIDQTQVTIGEDPITPYGADDYCKVSGVTDHLEISMTGSDPWESASYTKIGEPGSNQWIVDLVHGYGSSVNYFRIRATSGDEGEVVSDTIAVSVPPQDKVHVKVDSASSTACSIRTAARGVVSIEVSNAQNGGVWHVPTITSHQTPTPNSIYHIFNLDLTATDYTHYRIKVERDGQSPIYEPADGAGYNIFPAYVNVLNKTVDNINNKLTFEVDIRGDLYGVEYKNRYGSWDSQPFVVDGNTITCTTARDRPTTFNSEYRIHVANRDGAGYEQPPFYSAEQTVPVITIVDLESGGDEDRLRIRHNVGSEAKVWSKDAILSPEWNLETFQQEGIETYVSIDLSSAALPETVKKKYYRITTDDGDEVTHTYCVLQKTLYAKEEAVVAYNFESDISLSALLDTQVPVDTIVQKMSATDYVASTNTAGGWDPDYTLEQGDGFTIKLPGEDSGLATDIKYSLIIRDFLPLKDATISIANHMNLISYPYAEDFNLSVSELTSTGTGSTDIDSADKVYVRELVSTGGTPAYKLEYKRYALFDDEAGTREWRDTESFNTPNTEDVIIPLGEGFWYINVEAEFDWIPARPY